MVGLGIAIFVLQLLSSGAAIYLLRTQMQGIVHADRTRQVHDVRDDLLAAYYDGGYAELHDFIAHDKGSVADPLIFVALTGPGGTLLSNIAAIPRGVPFDRPGTVTLPQTGDERRTGLAIGTRLPGREELVVGALTETESRFDLAFAEAIGLTLTLTVGLALLSAVLLGTVISRRTHAIADTAEALGSGNFAARFPREDIGDGFDHLRRQMNLMAERIDMLIQQVHSISGSLAHDLQSPVARLRASIDTALACDDMDEPALEALQRARVDAEALQAMLAAALELGRLESGTVEDRRRMIELGEVVEDLTELYEPLAEQSDIELVWAIDQVRIFGDRELLSRALANLIDNALKYGANRIGLSCRAEGPWALVSVADNGPGIVAEDRERAMDRFTRLDNARTQPGAGLGLAMVAAVAQLHGGALELSGGSPSGGDTADFGGLVATLRLPR
ncbi:MAG: HAMP domain-containing histidine kinase [Sphingomonadales bacterium]|nr:HAMP domain-containing histidine kinase [Sphingomonadales bacterium]